MNRPASKPHYILIGPTPPPLGGISVYLSRLAKKLRAEGSSVEIIDRDSQNRFRTVVAYIRMLFIPTRVHIQLHAFDFTAMAMMLMRPFPKRTQYMDHNTAVYKRQLRGVRRFLFNRILRTSDEVVFVSEKAREYYKSDGFTIAPHVEFRSPFLPPHLEDEKAITASYSTETRRFITERNPLIVANASAIVFHEGVDLYGLDMCVELARRLKPEFPTFGLLFAIANSNGNAEYLVKMRDEVERLHLTDNFHFLTGQREIWPIFRHSDLIVRPTSDDGYGISLAEAMHLGSVALASDVTGRPQGTLTFRSRDADDFYRKTKQALTRGRQQT